MDAVFHSLRRVVRVCRGLGVALIGLWALASAVQAQSCPQVPRWCYGGGGFGVPNGAIACDPSHLNVAQAYAARFSGGVCTYQSNPYTLTYSATYKDQVNAAWVRYSIKSQCGPGPLSAELHAININASGTMDDPNCVSCTGKAGTETTINMTYGYARVPNAGNLAGDGFERAFVGPVWMAPTTPTNYCYQGCEVTTDRGRASMAWESRAPTAAGTYRWSADYTSTYSGQPCATGTTEANNPESQQTNAPIPSCDGAQGTVNGQPVCIAQNPSTQTHPPELGQAPTVQGNPTAGESPTGGTQGRVPATGNGGPAGGPQMTGDGQLSEGDGTGSLPTNPGTGGGGPGTVPDPEEGQCEANPSSAGCGGNPAPVGNLYTGKGKTWAQVLGGFRDTVSASPIGQGIGGFFTVSLGGQCPMWNWSIPYVNATVAFDFFCTAMAITVFQAISAVLMVVAGWFAFRVAVGD